MYVLLALWGSDIQSYVLRSMTFGAHRTRLSPLVSLSINGNTTVKTTVDYFRCHGFVTTRICKLPYSSPEAVPLLTVCMLARIHVEITSQNYHWTNENTVQFDLRCPQTADNHISIASIYYLAIFLTVVNKFLSHLLILT